MNCMPYSTHTLQYVRCTTIESYFLWCLCRTDCGVMAVVGGVVFAFFIHFARTSFSFHDYGNT